MELDKTSELEIEHDILYSAIEDELNENIKVAPKKKKKKKLRFKKEIKIRTLLLLIVTLIMNTYAWFIYITTVSVGMNMHIRSWDFELQNGSITQDFEFFVENIYPGVPVEDTVQVINAANNGELDALLSCEVQYVRILNDEFAVSQGFSSTQLTEFYTNQELLDKLYNDYPFKIKIYLITTDEDGTENRILYEGEEKTIPISSKLEIRLQVEWPYEVTLDDSNNIISEEADQIDTYWGEEAYKFHNENPDKYSIVVKVDILAKQKTSDDEEITP